MASERLGELRGRGLPHRSASKECFHIVVLEIDRDMIAREARILIHSRYGLIEF